jgi:E3 ubiquitin-protein ligase TRIP12
MVRTTTRIRTLAEGMPAMAQATKMEVAWLTTLEIYPVSLDESTAMAIVADYRQIGSYMSGLSTRLSTSVDPTTCIVMPQEPSELLRISTEDTLTGSFQVDAFVRELVKIFGGTGNSADDDDGDDNDDDSHEQDEETQLAAVLALIGGGQY